MRNRCLSVENQHMVHFSNAFWASMTSHQTSKLFQRRRETALKAKVVITTQQKTKLRGWRQQSEMSADPKPLIGWSSTHSLLHDDTEIRSAMLGQKWQ